jgi:hypothetical protein
MGYRNGVPVCHIGTLEVAIEMGLPYVTWEHWGWAIEVGFPCVTWERWGWGIKVCTRVSHEDAGDAKLRCRLVIISQ